MFFSSDGNDHPAIVTLNLILQNRNLVDVGKLGKTT